MDLLTGPDDRVRLAVGRTKNGRRRGFTLDERWLEPARTLATRFGLHFLSNVQFRMHGDRPVLMDVNTRPAGGLHQLSLCGVNAPWAAVRLALGEDPGEIVPPFLGQDYAVVSGPRPLCPVPLPQPEPQPQPQPQPQPHADGLGTGPVTGPAPAVSAPQCPAEPSPLVAPGAGPVGAAPRTDPAARA